MRTLAFVFLFAVATPSSAAVIVLSSFSPNEITVTITEATGKPQTLLTAILQTQ